ncbi:DUF2799 domain-containing protein [Gellertiella hungarica]|uniref:DUF2799 domain-containing protein n=1 Tax=Gellertiella hungarica TaxID=1572859 RepID=A0A7W6J222_9HYPH|nr:DUF2799 domain-containing protein [Gellertiella hungarica]MBB4063361.1 hypothetical protein [Gellertiella hungarica]
MRILLAFAMGLCLFGLASCYSLTKEECAAADWRVIGESDGAAGYDPQSRFADHTKSCARIKVVPDQSQWNEGYKVGVLRYCTPMNGLARGEAGDAYYNVCPPDRSAGFLKGYGIGQNAHKARNRVSELRNDISSKRSQMDERYALLKQTKDEAEYRRIRAEIDDLDRQMRWSRDYLRDAEFDLQDAEREVQVFRQNPNAILLPSPY